MKMPLKLDGFIFVWYVLCLQGLVDIELFLKESGRAKKKIKHSRFALCAFVGKIIIKLFRVIGKMIFTVL